MKSITHLTKIRALFVLCALPGFYLGSAHAATQYFSDAGGPLAWNTTTANWSAASGGPYNSAWGSGDAVFEGTGGTVNVGSVSADSLTFNVAGYQLSGGTITLPSTGAITKNADATISSALAGGGTNLTLGGTATLTLSNANAFTGAVAVGNGTVSFTKTGNLTYGMSGLNVASGATARFNAGGDIGFPAPITGAGTVLISGSLSSFRQSADNQAFTGTFATENGGSIDFVNAAAGWSANADYVHNGDWIRFYNTSTNRTIDLGSLAGTTAGSQIATWNGTGTTVLSVGANGHGTSFAGAILDKFNGSGGGIIALTKVGAGKLTLSGANTYTGATNVNAGTLAVDGSLAAASAVTVTSTGTLSGTGIIRGQTTVQGGGRLSPGTNGIGTLSIPNSLIFASGGIAAMDVNKTNSVCTSDRVQQMTSVTYGGTLLVTATGEALAAGDKFTLFTKASGAYSGAFTAFALPPLANGLDWDTSGLGNDGSISVIDTNAVAMPGFNPPAGTYSSAQSVTISSTIGSTLHYTTDGTTPTASSPSGASPLAISLNSALTLKVYATKSGLNDSPVATANYTFLIAPNVSYDTAPGGSIAISLSGLLAKCTGATAVQSVGGSANGATISADATHIYYAAGPGGGNSDSFTYVVNDGQGHTASAAVRINFVTTPNHIASFTRSNGEAALQVAASPGAANTIQTSTNLLDWETIGMSTAGDNGLSSFTAPATDPKRFFRTAATGNVSVGTWASSATPAQPAPLAPVLAPLSGGFRALACSYNGNTLVADRAFDWNASSNGLQGALQAGPARWNYNSTVNNLPVSTGTAVSMQWTATLVSGQVTGGGVAAAFDFANWSKDNYIMIPSAVYHGNRNRTEFNGYFAAFETADFYKPDLPQTQSDVPRLSTSPTGISKIEIRTGNAATPAMCFFSPAQQRGFILLTDQKTRFGDSGLMIEESADRSSASFVVSAPCVRKQRPLFVGFTNSSDTGATWNAGDSVTINLQLHSFPCADIPALLARFHEVRKNLSGPNQPRHITPASQLQAMYTARIDSMYKNVNGNQFYANENADWISFGWVGGLMNTFPMLALGDATHLSRVVNTFNFAIPAAQTASGYTRYKINSNGTLADTRTSTTGHSMNLARTQGDVLFWMIKQLKLLRAQGKASSINPAWEQFARNLAVAMTNTWNQDHEFGMFLDVVTGRVAIYNSTGGAMIPGGLALASEYFNEPSFMTVAQEAATMYYNRDIVGRGQTSGACDDILQNADSETSFGFMTSLMALYETTGDPSWLVKSRVLGDLCSTWTISYDYQFPPGTACYNLGAHVAGGVWASTQNKHAVAAICTSSGDPLFKLYRAGQGRRYAELVRDIAACANDLTARSDRPTYGSTPGNLVERLQTGDGDGAGEIGALPGDYNGWVVLGAMLQTMELPGIYTRLDTDEMFVFDHVTANLISRDVNGVTIDITNPTTLGASVTVMGENAAQAAQPLGYTAFINWPRVTVNAGATVRVLVKPNGSLQTL